MRRIILSSVVCPAVPYFTTLSRKRQDFRGVGNDEHKMCFDFIYNFCQKCFSFYEELNEIFSQTYTGLNVKYPLFLPDCYQTFITLTEFRKLLKYHNSWQSIQWEPSRSIRTDRHDEANGRISELFEPVLKKKPASFCPHLRTRETLNTFINLIFGLQLESVDT